MIRTTIVVKTTIEMKTNTMLINTGTSNHPIIYPARRRGSPLRFPLLLAKDKKECLPSGVLYYFGSIVIIVLPL